MKDRQSALAEVSKYCDLQERLAIAPASACWRGMFFDSITRALEREGKLDQYREIMPGTHSPVRHYPVTDLLERVAVGGAILRSPEQVHEGMFDIGRINALAFADSLLGRAMLRLLSRDPIKLLKQAIAGRRQGANYGVWRLELTSPNTATMHFEREYCWIESYMLGAGVGTFESVGVKGHFDVELDGPYDGRHLISWD